jgi:uncharacterized membrane protein YedE/YeeE
MENFSAVSAMIGGLLIGLSSAFLLFSLGRIAGISGIISGAITANMPEKAWRLSFIIGIIVAPVLWLNFNGIPAPEIDAPLPMLIVSGLLVGFGTSLGSGCTSGHGVCGLGRFSFRSLAATLIFMGMAGATVYVMRHIMGG